MPGPNKPVDEGHIKELMASSVHEERCAGLVLLDGAYRHAVSAHVRSRCGWLDSEGIRDNWRDAMLSITKAVMEGKFKARGSLLALMKMIAYFRAVDAILRKPPSTTNQDDGPESASDEPDVEALFALRETFKLLLRCASKLSPTRKMVFFVDLNLLLTNRDWPSVEELTEEVNHRHAVKMSEDAVRKNRSRARMQIAQLMEERGSR